MKPTLLLAAIFVLLSSAPAWAGGWYLVPPPYRRYDDGHRIVSVIAHGPPSQNGSKSRRMTPPLRASPRALRGI